jgi:HlyD family secretion protein
MTRKLSVAGRILKRLAIVIVVLAAAGAAAFYVMKVRGQDEEVQFSFAAVRRGDVEDTVSCTGTLSAVGTVSVGSQVSGTIEKLFVDFNDVVKKGQVLLKLDKSLFNAEVQSAGATLAKAKAELRQAEAEYERNSKLFEKGYVSQSDFILSETAVETARAALQSAQATLKRAKANQKYTVITSPIDGTVIERNVEEGQTIASSFSTPELFIIAEDLSKMQIEASVDESDIGLIKQGLPVRFTVQAYPDDEFDGTVRQIRLQPVTVQNVVTYTVVVDAANEKGLLMPGMTATVDFIVASSKDVLLVPNSAISFKPSAEMLRPPAASVGAGNPGSEKGMGAWKKSGTAGKGPAKHSGKACVHLKGADGLLSPSCFSPGITDGSVTEVVGETSLAEGIKLVTGTTTGKKTETEVKKSSGLPLPGMGGGKRGGPPGM